MSVKTYHKLVRDRISEIIEKSGKVCKTEILSDDEYLRMLDTKLDEELTEYHQDQNLEELADLLEVLLATVEARGYSVADLELVRKKKCVERGGFAKKILLKEVSDPVDPSRPTVKLELVMEAIELADDNSTAFYDLEKQELIWYMDDLGYQMDEDDEVSAGGVREQFEAAIRGRGAFRRFRQLVERQGMLDDWYKYKEKEQRKLAVEWCEENEFNYE